MEQMEDDFYEDGQRHDDEEEEYAAHFDAENDDGNEFEGDDTGGGDFAEFNEASEQRHRGWNHGPKLADQDEYFEEKEQMRSVKMAASKRYIEIQIDCGRTTSDSLAETESRVQFLPLAYAIQSSAFTPISEWLESLAKNQASSTSSLDGIPTTKISKKLNYSDMLERISSASLSADSYETNQQKFLRTAASASSLNGSATNINTSATPASSSSSNQKGDRLQSNQLFVDPDKLSMLQGAGFSRVPLRNVVSRLDKVSKLFPSRFSFDHFCHQYNHDNIKLSQRGLRASYTGTGHSDRDAASVRSNVPIPRGVLGIYYFEAFIVSKGRDGWMGIGLCAKETNLDRLPGWEPKSFGYHGDDGFMFESSGKGKPYGPTYTTGDYIGCIVNFRDKSILFTKNGLLLGVAFKNVRFDFSLYPTVGFRTPGEVMDINFGESQFKFDIEAYVREEQVKLWKNVEPVCIISDHYNGGSGSDYDAMTLIHSLVVEHLEHSGYHGTAALLRSKVIGKQSPNIDSSTAMEVDESDLGKQNLKPEDVPLLRRKIRSCIMRGDIPSSLSIINTHFPTLLTLHRNIFFALKCRHFIECIYSSIQDAARTIVNTNKPNTTILPSSRDEHAIQIGRQVMELFGADAETCEQIHAALEETFSLAAYSTETLASAVLNRGEGGGENIAVVRKPVSRGTSFLSPVFESGCDSKATDVAASTKSKVEVPVSVTRLLDPVLRDHLAGMVDKCILMEAGSRTDSVLERNLKHGLLLGSATSDAAAAVVGGALLESVWNHFAD